MYQSKCAINRLKKFNSNFREPFCLEETFFKKFSLKNHFFSIRTSNQIGGAGNLFISRRFAWSLFSFSTHGRRHFFRRQAADSIFEWKNGAGRGSSIGRSIWLTRPRVSFTNRFLHFLRLPLLLFFRRQIASAVHVRWGVEPTMKGGMERSDWSKTSHVTLPLNN